MYYTKTDAGLTTFCVSFPLGTSGDGKLNPAGSAPRCGAPFLRRKGIAPCGAAEEGRKGPGDRMNATGKVGLIPPVGSFEGPKGRFDWGKGRSGHPQGVPQPTKSWVGTPSGGPPTHKKLTGNDLFEALTPGGVPLDPPPPTSEDPTPGLKSCGGGGHSTSSGRRQRWRGCSTRSSPTPGCNFAGCLPH